MIVPKPLQPIRQKKIETYQEQLAVRAEKLVRARELESEVKDNNSQLQPDAIKIKLQTQ